MLTHVNKIINGTVKMKQVAHRYKYRDFFEQRDYEVFEPYEKNDEARKEMVKFFNSMGFNTVPNDTLDLCCVYKVDEDDTCVTFTVCFFVMEIARHMLGYICLMGTEPSCRKQGLA